MAGAVGMHEDQRRSRTPGDLRAAVRRDLSAAERGLLWWMVEHGTADPAAYRGQLPRLRVIGRCTCGCPTVELGVDGESPPADEVSRLVADAEGLSPDGLPVGVLLFARAGVLSELEVYSASGEGPIRLPVPDTLTPSPPRSSAEP